MRRNELVTLLVAGAVLAGGCAHARVITGHASAQISVETPKPTRAAPVRAASVQLLRRFRDCSAITSDLRAQALRYVGPFGLGGNAVVPEFAGNTSGVALRAGAAEDKGAAAPAAAPTAPRPSVDFSQTNVQEAGVDEPDTAKTDGRTIFAVAGQTLHAADVSTAHPRLLGSLGVPTYGAQLLLSGTRLLVIGGAQNVVEPMSRPAFAGPGPVPSFSSGTSIEVVDVSNPASMRVLDTLHIDGDYVDARQIDGIARVVVRRANPVIPFTYPQDGRPETATKSLEANRQAVARAGVAQWIPLYTLTAGGKSSSGAVSSCADTYRPTAFSGFGTVSVVTVDPRDPRPRGGSTVIGGATTIYASRTNLYVTSQQVPLPAPGLDGPAIAPVPAQTEIHQFDIGGRTAVYRASGVIAGTLVDQFSMSELDGRLRVATTTGIASEFAGQSTSRSSVTVLERRGSTLFPVGVLTGLGADQRIYAVRFVGNIAYVVTFRQIDPLYTIDLSNPRLPRVAGQLHIPGFSSYLHPIGGGLLLGVGEQVDASARPIGTKISLFDVSDITHPRELQNLSLGGPNFQTNFDHHAFLWWAPLRMAVLPLQTYAMQPNGQDYAFNGAVTLRVSAAGMHELKRLTQPTSPQQMLPITRSLVADRMLFTLSDAGLMASDLHSLDQRAWLPFS